MHGHAQISYSQSIGGYWLHTSYGTMALPTGRTRVTITLPDAELAWLRQHVEVEGRTISSQLAILIRRYRDEVEQQ